MNKIRLNRKRTEYLSEKSRLPSHPEMYVLYTGEEHHDETELKLSEELLSGFSAAEKKGDISDQYVACTKILREADKERGAEVMAAVFDIFDQKKVWEMALKAERRKSREEGLKEGLEKGLEKEAAACLAGYGRCDAGLSREGDSREN